MKTPPSRIIPQLLTLIAISGLAYYLGFQQGQSHTPAPIPAAKAETSTPPIPDLTPSLPSEPNTSEAAQLKPPPARPHRNGTSSRDLGYADAQTDFEAALLKAQDLPPREQADYVAGLFSFLAVNSAPADALTIATAQEGRIRGTALKALVASWTQNSSALTEQQKHQLQGRVFNTSGARLGLEVELASFIAKSDISPSISEAWKNAFAEHPARSEISVKLLAGKSPQAITTALSQADSWTDWEKNRFTESLLSQWSRESPHEAWSWYQENEGRFSADYSEQIIQSWAAHKPDDLIATLKSMSSPALRSKAIESISSSLAQRGTQQALEWVNGLENPEEQNLAYQAVYQATPKGIGAMVKASDGFTRIEKILPGGALEATQLQEGDLLVSAREAGNEPQDLYGIPLHDTITRLRGAPGTSVEVTVLRTNPQTGKLEEHKTTVVRDLLILESQNRD